MKPFLFLILSIFAIVVGSPEQRAASHVDEPLYLPNGRAIELLSFGYRNALSDYLWMQTISYFGKHYQSDKKYDWLAHQCKLVTKLNPKSFEPFYLCTSLLAWEANDPASAIELLDEAVNAQPDTWLFFYFRGFYRLYFNHDNHGAKSDFIAASKRPDAHPIAARLASKSMAELESSESAIEFLTSAINATQDENARNALQARLKELVYEDNLSSIASALKSMPEAKTLKELYEAGLYQGPNKDPFGGEYLILEGIAKSTSAYKRLSEYRGVQRKP